MPAPSNTAFPGWRRTCLPHPHQGSPLAFLSLAQAPWAGSKKEGPIQQEPWLGLPAVCTQKKVKFSIILLYLKNKRELCCKGLVYNLIPLCTVYRLSGSSAPLL